MGLKLAVVKETAAAESRVAATPESVKKLIGLGFEVTVQKDAGAKANYTDAAYQAAGAKLASSQADSVKNADIVLGVQLDKASLAGLKKGALLVGIANPYGNAELMTEAAKADVTLLAMELVPRITRAQSMDVLSSQANLAGYRAVLEASAHYARAFPMMMTAAGTIAPARVFIMGAGVAGLQAIATARRLGAVVSATDVRMAAKEQVASLGASFVMVEDEETKAAETSGGYAKEMSDAYKAKQAALIAETIQKQDIVITTALIPGRKAPLLVTEEMVASMKPGSVIVDMAVEQGGNVALSKQGAVVEKNGVKIVGPQSLVGQLATDSSALYARNLTALLGLLVKDGTLSVNWEDEIVAAITLTRSGHIVHPNFGSKKEASPAKTAAPKAAKEKDAPAVKKPAAKKPAAKSTKAKPKS